MKFTLSALIILLLFVFTVCGTGISEHLYVETAVPETQITEGQTPETHHPESTPVHVPTLALVPIIHEMYVSVGWDHTMAITADGSLWGLGT